MDRASTAAAFSATAAGKALTGKIAWAENDTVLVFTPSVRMPTGAPIKITVADTAESAAGVGLGATATATSFKAGKAPVAKSGSGPGPGRQPRGRTPTPKPKPIPHSSGGSVGSGSWHAVETYYLKLMNCTRTGGWVTSSGSCSSPGGLSTAPIVLDAGLSDKVSRPYAKLLATDGACDHFINGTPTDRLHRAGYSGWAAENIGCRSAANGYASVLGTHLFFQDEKPCGGYCHYANLMNPAYKRCGIGVWIAARAGPARHRLLPLVGVRSQRRAASAAGESDDRPMIKNVIVHLHNEQPLMADLYQMPAPTDSALVCTNLRDMNGKRPVFIDDSASYFSFSLTVVRFVEVPAASVRAAGEANPEMGLVVTGDVEAPARPAAVTRPGPARTRRIRTSRSTRTSSSGSAISENRAG